MIAWFIGNVDGPGVFAFAALVAGVTVVAVTLLTRETREMAEKRMQLQHERTVLDSEHGYQLHLKRLEQNLITSHREEK